MRIDDGHQTLITFAADSDVKIWEKTITPPGVDGGGANDTTTMRNTMWRTMAPKKLKTLTNSSATVAYDPVFYNEAVAMINVNQLITFIFPDSSEIAIWGWLNTFTPGEVVEGSQPTAECVIIPSNQNTTQIETGPAYTAPG